MGDHLLGRFLRNFILSHVGGKSATGRCKKFNCSIFSLISERTNGDGLVQRIRPVYNPIHQHIVSNTRIFVQEKILVAAN